MAWTERQRAMLAEMGIVVWNPAVDAAPVPDDATAAVAGRVAPPAARPAPVTLPASAAAGESSAFRLDPDALREAVAGCTACALAAGRRHTVFGSAPLRADWMIVGEAPGAAEDADGEPFAGDAGRLLDNMLRALGLVRAAAGVDPARSVCLAHVVKCRPPGDRNPAPGELIRCAPYLQRQIELVRPRILLAMGRFAVEGLLQTTEPLGRLRGRVHDCAGVPLIVTYAPAYLLRHLEEKARAWDDLCLARETLQGLPVAATSST
ncbi:MAG: uracil-DNA glycosylase [Burkholderiaceae bacterium]